ncbi:hypothetical protein C0J52_16788 [Blattella germanica]|nr:hypothetical protein C0J52_16788 [Blattella germanica]
MEINDFKNSNEKESFPSSQRLQDNLLESLLSRDIITFQKLLKDPQVNPSHKYGYPHWSTCLEIASRHKGCEEFIRALLQSGVKPNINVIVPEPIHYAASRENDDTLRILLYERCIALLFSRSDMDVNRPNKKGCTALYEAAHFGGRDAVVAMLKHGFHILDLDSTRGVGKSPHEIIMQRYPDLRNSLPPPKVEQLQSDSHSQLLAAFQHRQLNVFRDLLCQVDIYGNARLNPNFWYNAPYNSTCLEMACKETGCEEFAQALLKAGADPNTVNLITKKSPLHTAVQFGNHEALCVLLQDKRSNVNMIDELGKTPLHIAVDQHWGSDDDTTRLEECVTLLLEHQNINVNILDKNGHTAIHTAALRGNKQAVQFILQCERLQLDLDSPLGSENKSTRDLIINKFSDFKRLLSQKSLIEDNGKVLKETLFQYLYKRQTEEFIKDFKENMKSDIVVPIREADDGCFTFLQYACNYGLIDVVQLLLEFNANPNATSDYDKRPPIILTCLKNNLEILNCFLELQADANFNINASDAKGNTALHYAARNEDLNIVIALLSHGADMKIKNIFGELPLSSTVVKRLLDHSLNTNEHFPEDENYELIFNYSFLLAQNKEDYLKKSKIREEILPLVKSHDEESISENRKMRAVVPEMDLLFHFSQSQEHRNLLKHPIITSFLHLKWLRIRATYYTNLVLYILFLILLNIYILMDYGQQSRPTDTNNIMMNNSEQNITDEGKEDNDLSHLARFKTMYGNIIWFSLLFILFCHTIRELFKFVMSPSRYLLTLDTMLDLALVFITAIVLFKSWEDEENRKLFTAFALFLSWVVLALIIGRLPLFSINIQMLKSVSKHYVFIFLSYFFIIIAFGVSFYIFYYDNWNSYYDTTLCVGNETHPSGQCTRSSDSLQYRKHSNVMSNSNENEEQTLWTSVTQAALYVAGGFSASFIPIDRGYSFIMLLLFAFIVIMVMINILTGIAVNEVKFIQDNADELFIESRITLLYETESILIYWNRFMEKLCKFDCAFKMSSYLNTTLRKIIVFPDVAPTEKKVSVLPNKNGKIMFPNQVQNDTPRMKMDILKSAITIIGNKGKISLMDELKLNIKQNHNEDLQNIQDCHYTLDKIQNKMENNNIKVQKLEENINKLQNKLDKDNKSLDTNFKNLIDQCQLQMAHIQENLQEKLNQYEYRFNWIEQSHKQTTDLLTEILSILHSENDESFDSQAEHN